MTTPADLHDERLGAFVHKSYWPGWEAELDRNGEAVVLVVSEADADTARALLPRLGGVVEDLTSVSRAGIRYLVDQLSTEPVAEVEYVEAYTDLAVTDVVVDATGTVTIHFSDGCGEHFLDGYWPSVSFDAANEPVSWSLEA
ncbi:hypothetical protein [Stackebrandtia soli]|uniref:hypothetical protein n=1 Tax=Stackebrandtia soli TaxID=1892856 RepID=UPI0039E9653B